MSKLALKVWRDVLLDPTRVWVLEYNGILSWTDKFSFARVPLPLAKLVRPGLVYSVGEDAIEPTGGVIEPEKILDILDSLALAEKWPVTLKGTGLAALKQGKTEVDIYQNDLGSEIWINHRLSKIIFSTVERGAKIYMNKLRTMMWAELEGEVVALVSPISPGLIRKSHIDRKDL